MFTLFLLSKYNEYERMGHLHNRPNSLIHAARNPVEDVLGRIRSYIYLSLSKTVVITENTNLSKLFTDYLLFLPQANQDQVSLI